MSQVNACLPDLNQVWHWTQNCLCLRSRRGTTEYWLKVSFAVHCHHSQILFSSFVKSGCNYLPFRVLVSIVLGKLLFGKRPSHNWTDRQTFWRPWIPHSVYWKGCWYHHCSVEIGDNSFYHRGIIRGYLELDKLPIRGLGLVLAW